MRDPATVEEIVPILIFKSVVMCFTFMRRLFASCTFISRFENTELVVACKMCQYDRQLAPVLINMKFVILHNWMR